ncbi:MAG: GcrA family cell cycle regulator [Pseudomonadota bacterium]
MKCFVICPIGDQGSEARKQSDDVLEYIICEALKPLGFEIERADTIAESGIITSQIIERVTTADLVVADLSRHNANVFYELAIRHVTGKPFVQLIDQREKIPFDVASSRTIQYSLDLHGAKRAREELALQVKSIIEGKTVVENPISVAVDLKALATSEDPIKTALLRIENEISAVRASVEKLGEPIRISLSESSGGSEFPKKLTASDLIRRMTESHSDNNFSSGGWTDEKVEELKSMWSVGVSASEIGKLLGFTRNAVIGKVHRLGLHVGKDPSQDDQ